MKKVILSVPLLLEEGVYRMEEIDLQTAKDFAKDATNYVAHSTAKLLGIHPAASREVCIRYDIAVVIKVSGRLEFGKEYSLEMIESIGYRIFKITKIS